MATTRQIDGYSESLWKSLAVKSLRMGWPAGLEAAEDALNPSAVKYQVMCGIFEDVFPAEDEIQDVLQLVEKLEYEELCRYETHHGRGYTTRFCELKEEAVEAANKRREEMYPKARELGIYVPWRAFNCFYTWLTIRPQEGGRRSVDERPFEGVPRAVADNHTREGYQDRYQPDEEGDAITVLSGNYEQHARLGRAVGRLGWKPIREQVHGDLLPPPPSRQEALNI